jgi:fibronectin type 3 domain-containing protein
VTATSVADSTKSASASVTVSASSSTTPIAVAQTVLFQNALSASVPMAQTAGNYNVLAIEHYGQTINSITDTQGNVYARACGPFSTNDGSTEDIEFWTSSQIKAAAAGTNTVTINMTGIPTYKGAVLYEVQSASPLAFDQCANQVTRSATSASSGTTGITRNANSLLIAVTNPTVAVGAPPPSPWTSDGDPANTYGNYAHMLVSTTGNYSATWTSGTSQTWNSAIAVFGATSAASPSSAAITINPTSVSLPTGGNQQFTATVTGTTNTAVTWSGTGGTISTSGLYTAPNTPGTYTLTATSVADSTKSASATVTVSAPVNVTISPTSTSVQTGTTQQFTATVTGSSNTSVTWSATGGTVTTSGLYTAPSTAGTYTVTATSVADPTKSASAAVTVSTAQVVSVTVSPTSSSLQTSQTQQFTATVSGSTNTAVTWSATGGTVSTAGLYTAPNVAGTYTVTAKSVADTTKSASATVAVAATQLLSASPTGISFGNVLVGNTSSQNVTLTNTGGGSVTVTAANFTGGVYSASGLTLPLTLAAGATKTVAINFVPGVSGPASGSVSFVSNASNSPATVTLSGTGVAPQPHSVDLSWVGSPSSGVVGYYVYRSTTSGSGYTKLNSGSVASTTTYSDSTVQSGTTYYYVVTAVDGSGTESSYSNQASAIIPTP